MALRKKFNYFDSFKEQAKLAIKESEILIEVIDNFVNAEGLYDYMQKAHDVEHAGDVVNHKILKNIAKDFITPIDREDLMVLAMNLDNIIDEIEDIVQHFYVYDVHKIHPACKEFAKILNKSCNSLYAATTHLENFKKEKRELKEAIVEVNDLEDEADVYYIDIMRELYKNHSDKHMQIIIWSGIFDLFENCCDACEHAADVMDSTILKNS